MGIRRLGLLCSVLLLFNISFSQLYANINIDVSSNGEISINGLTNYNFTGSYLVRRGEYWLLNISTKENFSSYVYELILPKGATINYISTTKINSISEYNGRIKIVGIGDNEPFKLIVQYKVDDFESNLLFYFSSFVFTVIVLIFVFRQKKDYNTSLMTERERKIFKLIKKRKRITQNEICKALDLPKSSVSRNINSLIRKGFIEKIRVGVSNFIVLKR